MDRDGTLIEEVNFLSRVEDLRLFPFTSDAIQKLKAAGFLIIVVTNQSGIGREIFSEKDMHAIHEAIQGKLNNQIDAFYFCPHLPPDGCACRKPKLGMIEAAAKDFKVDIASSWMIGDKKIDIETGINAGMGTAMVKTGYGSRHLKTLVEMPTITAENLLDAVETIVSSGRH